MLSKGFKLNKQTKGNAYRATKCEENGFLSFAFRRTVVILFYSCAQA